MAGKAPKAFWPKNPAPLTGKGSSKTGIQSATRDAQTLFLATAQLRLRRLSVGHAQEPRPRKSKQFPAKTAHTNASLSRAMEYELNATCMMMYRKRLSARFPKN